MQSPEQCTNLVAYVPCYEFPSPGDRDWKKGEERKQTELSNPISTVNLKLTEGRNPQCELYKNGK